MFADFSTFLMAVVFVAINGITMIAWGAQMGYKLKPTSFAFFLAGLANALTGNVVPLSGQSSILTISNYVKNTNERVAALIIATVVMVPLGIFGVVSAVADYAGQPVILGMMAGVGLMISTISVDLARKDIRTGLISIATALVAWWLFVGNQYQLVYVIAISVTVSTLDFLFLQKNKETGRFGRRVNFKNLAKEGGFTGDMDEDEEYRPWKREYWQGFKITRPKFGFNALYYSLAFICISIGTIIAFGNITAGMAGVENPVDTLTVINGLVDIPTVLFGGMPIEVVISATANAPWPILAGIVMMLLVGVLLLFGIVSRIVKYLPAQSIVGFLLVIGFFSTFRPNLVNAFNTGYTSQASAALLVTAVTKNPFLGIVAGVLVRYIGSYIGLP